MKILLLILLNVTLGFSQSPSPKRTKGSHPATISFGGITKGGEIAIRSHLEDSLFFTDPEINLTQLASITP
ncbi:MAG: hypothetical protein ABI763_12705 [Bacteroidota bacterium]